MPAHAMTMDAAIEDSSPTARGRPEPVARAWTGAESPWVLAATAAAPWPLWSLLAFGGIPGSAHVPAISHGVLALAAVLALMGLWTHRPPVRSALKWSMTVVGTGLMGELLANALTDMGRDAGIGGASDGARAIVVWGLCVAVYEVAPIVAATARVTRSERRRWSLDLVAHPAFVLAAAGAYAWEPTWGDWWFVSPWLAVAVALPLAAARSGPRHEAALPRPRPRGGVLFGVAAIGGALLAAYAAVNADVIRASVHDMRWGVEAIDGVLLALPTVSLALSLVAAGALIFRALRVRHSAAGTIAEVGDRGVTIELLDDPTSVAIDEGPMPQVGQSVTLIGAAPHPPGVGPFRDGAPQLRARRAWVGEPSELSRALMQRAAGWLVWSTACGLGLLLRLL